MRVTKRAKIIWGVLLALFLAFAGLLAARRFSSSPTPPSVAVAAPVQKKSAPQAASGKKDAGRIPDAVPVLNTIAQAVAGRLGRITELQAQEQELRLEASIAKLRKEKEEALRAPAVPLSLPALTRLRRLRQRLPPLNAGPAGDCAWCPSREWAGSFQPRCAPAAARSLCVPDPVWATP
jgi:hypothetical protein